VICPVVEFKLVGPEATLKRDPLMTSSYSANRDKTFDKTLGGEMRDNQDTFLRLRHDCRYRKMQKKYS